MVSHGPRRCLSDGPPDPTGPSQEKTSPGTSHSPFLSHLTMNKALSTKVRCGKGPQSPAMQRMEVIIHGALNPLRGWYRRWTCSRTRLKIATSWLPRTPPAPQFSFTELGSVPKVPWESQQFLRSAGRAGAVPNRHKDDAPAALDLFQQHSRETGNPVVGLSFLPRQPHS